MAHLGAIHQNSVLLGGDLEKVHHNDFAHTILHHIWEPSWSAGQPPYKHLAYMTLKHRSYFFGYKVMDIILDVTQVGPACVILKFTLSILNGWLGTGHGTLIQAVTPLGPFRHRVVHLGFVEPSFIGRVLGKFLLHGEAPQV